MKALLVADDEMAIENISQVLKSNGYDTIVYKWLLKALDNIEEIAPHLIVVSTADYPRHWKTLAQYATSGFGDYSPQIILYTDENFGEEEQKKAEALHVRGTFDSVGVDGLDKLREILTKKDDIYSGHPTPVSDDEIEEIHGEDDTFDELLTKFEKTNNMQKQDEIQKTEEAIADEKAANRLQEIIDDEKAADRLEEIISNKQENLNNENVPTVSEIINSPYYESEFDTLPGIEELKKLLAENDFSSYKNLDSSDDLETSNSDEKDFEDSKNNDIIRENESFRNGENDMADEQSINDKLAEIMNANKADAKEKAEALKLDTSSNSVSFVFTNPITLAMVSGVARNYNGLVLEFTPDIPSFILNLSPGTKIDIASMKINNKIENVLAEVMSNDAKKIALAIKKIS